VNSIVAEIPLQSHLIERVLILACFLVADCGFSSSWSFARH
jgi:hypothetical protein